MFSFMKIFFDEWSVVKVMTSYTFKKQIHVFYYVRGLDIKAEE